MKQILAVSVLAAATTALLSQTPGDKNAAEQNLIQMERDWSRADAAKDVTTLERILADDWSGIDFEGVVLSKPEALKGLASDSVSIETTVLGDLKVRIYGNTAVVTGTDTEKSQYHGQDSSGKYLWTDVFVQRDGRWRAVSSQSTKVATR